MKYTDLQWCILLLYLFVCFYLFCFCIFKKSIYLAVLNVSCGTWDFSALTRDDIARCRGPLGKSELPSFLKPHTFHCVYVYTTFWLFIHLLMDACIALCSWLLWIVMPMNMGIQIAFRYCLQLFCKYTPKWNCCIIW